MQVDNHGLKETISGNHALSQSVHDLFHRIRWILGGALVLLSAQAVFAQYTITNLVDSTTVLEGGGTVRYWDNAALNGKTVVFSSQSPEGPLMNQVCICEEGKIRLVAPFGPPKRPGLRKTVFRLGGSPTISGTTVVFDGYEGDIGFPCVLSSSKGNVSYVADATPGRAPGGATFTSVVSSSISGNRVVFVGGYKGGAGARGVFTKSGDTISTLASDGTGELANVPGGGTFTGFSFPCIDDSRVLFVGRYTNGWGTQGIFLNEKGKLRAVVRNTPDSVPEGGKFALFSDPVMSDGRIAFGAVYTQGVGGKGIFLLTSNGIQRIASDGGGTSLVPGGGRFVSFLCQSLSSSTLAFQGVYRSSEDKPPLRPSFAISTSGIFAYRDGKLQSVVRQGDSLFGSTVIGTMLGKYGVDGDNIAFVYNLADGREGIAIASLKAVTR